MDVVLVVEGQAQPQKYTPIAKLGRGGMADVYLVISKSAGSVVKLLVMKQLRPSLSDDPNFQRMFLDEARLAVRLSHPNVVQTYEVGQYEGAPIIVMDYLEGVSLSELRRKAMREKQWRPEVGFAVLIDALSGLEYAHDLRDYDGSPLSIVHRDFTPQNIFVTFDGFVKVLDFGIAKAKDSTSQTETGHVKGTIRYVAPEVIRGQPVDRRADVYAAGIVLMEIATGRRMWDGCTDVAIIRSVADGNIPTLLDIQGAASPELNEICRKATASDPDHRYPSARALSDDIRQHMMALGSAVSSRMAGDIAQEFFGERRAEIRTLIEKQIKEHTSHQVTADLGVGQDLPIFSLKSETGSRRSQTIERTLTHTKQESSRKAVPLLALFLALTLGLLAWQQIAGRTNPSAEARHPVAARQPAMEDAGRLPAPENNEADMPEATPEAPKDITITVTANPSHAKLFLKNEPLPSNPAIIHHPLDESIQTIKAEAPGFEAKTLAVAMVKDLNLQIELQPVKKPTAPKRPRRVAPVPKAPTKKETNPKPEDQKPSKDRKAPQIIRSTPWSR